MLSKIDNTLYYLVWVLIALTVGFPSLAGMAASQEEFFGSKVGSALFEEYQEILDCSSREVWMVTQKRMGM